MAGSASSSVTTVVEDERTPLLRHEGHRGPEDPPNALSSESVEEVVGIAKPSILTILPTLLLGVFVAQADSSIVLAISQDIASEFTALSDASWLITTYALAQCACQPMYGKMSDVFGRKPALAFSYIVFALGCALCGIGTSYWHVLAGRAISGIGGAGMVGLVAVIIADILPPREVARWRSYVNVIATLGRSCGGPAGGWLSDNIGWRWAFLGQSPVAILATLLIIWQIPSTIAADKKESRTFKEKIARIDFAGFFALPSGLIAAFLALDFVSKMYPWALTVPLATLAALLLGVFYYVEKYHAVDPIISMNLLSRSDVYIPYILVALQTAAQFIATYTVPIYFQIITGMSATAAGSRIVVIVIGNAVGGLLTGWLVSRTGSYKVLTFLATLLGVTSYVLVLVRWHGTSSWLDTWYLVLGGLGMGCTQNTTFVHLAASLDPSDMAVAGTTWFLSQSVGMLVSANMFDLIHNMALGGFLDQALDGLDNKKEIIAGAFSSIEYIMSLPKNIRELVVRAVVQSLVPTNALALACGVTASVCVLFIKERKLEHR